MQLQLSRIALVLVPAWVWPALPSYSAPRCHRHPQTEQARLLRTVPQSARVPLLAPHWQALPLVERA